MNIFDILMITFIALTIAAIFIRHDKRYAYSFAFLIGVSLAAKQFIVYRDPLLSLITLALFGLVAYRERDAFIGSSEKRQWRKWPWY